MNLRTAAPVAGIVGGTCWVARLVLDLLGSADSAASEILYWAGLVFLAIAFAEAGISLVRKGTVWLRAIVGIAFPLLVWSLVEFLHPVTDPEIVDGICGLIVLVVAVVQLNRLRGEAAPRRRHAGLHAR